MYVLNSKIHVHVSEYMCILVIRFDYKIEHHKLRLEGHLV